MKSTLWAAMLLSVVGAASALGQPTAPPARSDAAQDTSIRLIVRGDDFGYSHASNEALGPAFEEGIMRAASVLVPGPWFLETAELVRAHPEWTIGIHLTITAEWNRLRWRPISPISEVPSLVAPDGFLYGNGYYREPPNDYSPNAAPWAHHPPDLAQVEKELRAQVRYAQQNGVRIDYLDCHMGLACSEQILPVMKKLAAELCVPIASRGFLGEQAVRLDWQRNTIEEARELIGGMLGSLQPGLWLYVGHPARDSAELRAVDSEVGLEWATRRNAVFEIWRDPEIKRLVAERNIQLVSPRDLWNSGNCRLK